MEREIKRCIGMQDRRGLKARRVTSNRGELVLPQPAQRLLAVLDAAEVGGLALREGVFFGCGQGGVGGCEAGTDEEDVARASLDVGFLDDLLQGGERDRAGGEGREGDGVLSCPCRVVDEDAAADDAAFLDPCCLFVCLSIAWSCCFRWWRLRHGGPMEELTVYTNDRRSL